MRKLLLCFYLLTAVGSGHAQGTTQFTAHLTGNTFYDGTGTFSLTGDVLTYDVEIPTVNSFGAANIQGPGPDPGAPAIFNLHLTKCVFPEPPFDPGGCVFTGSFTLSADQEDQLRNGEWYVNAFGPDPFVIRGQIVSVPEPSAALIAVVGLSAFAFRLSKTDRGRQRSRH